MELQFVCKVLHNSKDMRIKQRERGVEEYFLCADQLKCKN